MPKKTKKNKISSLRKKLNKIGIEEEKYRIAYNKEYERYSNLTDKLGREHDAKKKKIDDDHTKRVSTIRRRFGK